MSLLTIQKIPAFVEVNLKVGALDVELKVFLHAVDVVEDILNDPWNDSLKSRVIDDTLHCVSFSTGGLAVGEYSSVVTR